MLVGLDFGLQILQRGLENPHELLILQSAVVPSEEHEDVQKLLRMVRAANIAPPSTLRRGVPVELEQIAMRCLQKDIASRYATGADLAAALEEYLHAQTPAFTAGKLARFVDEVLTLELTAGERLLEVSLDGYNRWQREIRVFADEPQVIEPRKPDVDRQHHRQHKLIRGHGPGGPFHGDYLFHHLLES